MRACPVCSFSFVPKLTLRGICKESPVDYYWYLSSNDKLGLFYDGYKGDKIYSSGDFRIWNFTESADNSPSYSIELFNGPGTPIGHKLWEASDSFCNYRSHNKTEIIISICVLGVDFTCYSGECISKYKICDNFFDCADHSGEDNCKKIVFNKMDDKSRNFEICIEFALDFIFRSTTRSNWASKSITDLNRNIHY